MIWVGRVLWLIFISTCLVAPAFSMLALSVAGAQTTLDKRQPMLMTAYKWASLTERQRQIYIRGFLETVSFLLYGHSQKDNKEHAKIFSEWTMWKRRGVRSQQLTQGGYFDKVLGKFPARIFYHGTATSHSIFRCFLPCDL